MLFQNASATATSHVTVIHGVIGQIVMAIASKPEFEIKMHQKNKLNHVTVKVSVFSMWRMISMKILKRARFRREDQNEMHQKPLRD